MKKIYIAGPMTGLPDFNYPAFHAAAAELRAQGHHVENPAENPTPACGSWNGYMRQALPQLMRCDAIYLLPGWMASKGARLESRVAIDLGMQRMYHPDEADNMERLKEAMQDAAAQGMRVCMVDGGPVFLSCEGDVQCTTEDLDCPACGGSGHKGDVQTVPNLLARVKELEAKTTSCMGVGGGDGKLFVYGDYASIKAAQAIVFRAENNAQRMCKALQWTAAGLQAIARNGGIVSIAEFGENKSVDQVLDEANAALGGAE